MNYRITTGCIRCDNFYAELAAINKHIWQLEDKAGDSETRSLLKQKRADKKLHQTKLDEHISEAHQLVLPL